MKIVNCEDVRKTVGSFSNKEPKALEDVFVWLFNNHGEYKESLKSEECKKNKHFLEYYFKGALFDCGVYHSYPNGVICITTGNKGEREEVTYNNVFNYFEQLSALPLINIAESIGEGNIEDIFIKFKSDFFELSGESFTALTDNELLQQLHRGLEFSKHGRSVNTPVMVLEIKGDSFKCCMDDSDVIEIPQHISLSYSQMKSEKKGLEDYPFKYLTKKLLGFAVSEGIINAWEYKFYLDILSKPKPRKLSKRQSDMYKAINSKIMWSL